MSDFLYKKMFEELSRPAIEQTLLPQSVTANLTPAFVIRPYQQRAFQHFINYWEKKFDGKQPANHQLLFHMATGSGKTLIMAGLILYLYEKGYRNFLFFVNSTNIIEKTRTNFLNPISSKYLFAPIVSIGDKKICIKEVESFQAVNEEDINIVFETIQGLHSKLNAPRENSITYDDFEDKKIVLISDEAHHINAETKKGNKLTADELLEVVSWERTVYKIFKANKDNVLLEFTATADLTDENVAQKYNDKLLFDYPLRQFRKDGYSKEVKVLQSDRALIERAMQGVLLSQYRRKVFEKHRQAIKPVVLFKSKTIHESRAFLEEFIGKIKNLKVSDLKALNTPEADKIIKTIFEYFNKNGIAFEDIVSELKEDFSETKLISVNSKDESEQKQLAVNSLEDKDNEYRAVFAVDKLNEGWDVLNLFDIVRLYDTRDARGGRPGATTMSEAQLIGRGARYCPFKLSPEQPVDRRKYDEDIENELRVCEELYYHSVYNVRYIQELNTALQEIGITAKETIERPIKLKDNFKKTDFYKAGFLFLNEQQKHNRENVFGFNSIIIDNLYKVKLRTGFGTTTIIFSQSEQEAVERKQKDYNIRDFGKHIVRKAISRLEFFRFYNLTKYLPNLHSINEFISSNNYLGKIKAEVSGLPKQLDNLSADDKLEISVQVLKEITSRLTSDKVEFQGTKEFKPYLLKDKIKDKVLNFSIDDGDDKECGKAMSNVSETKFYLDLGSRDWYVFNDCFGTSEEKKFVKYLDKVYDKLKAKYDEVYLVRNERYFKLFAFDGGRPLEPDFVLFLIRKSPTEMLYYQIFIEPKGGHLLQEDKWKETFLESLKNEGRIEQLWKDRKYIIWGMPFYNEQLKRSEFETAFEVVLK